MGVLKNLHEVDLRNTSMSCLGTPERTAAAAANTSAAEPQQCDDSQLLPCFLSFSKVTHPLTDNSNMACPVILRRPKDEAVHACAGEGAHQLGEQAGNIADVQATQQTWDVDPSYYQYRPCRCLEVSSGRCSSSKFGEECS
jgi:hypothetical protein